MLRPPSRTFIFSYYFLHPSRTKKILEAGHGLLDSISNFAGVPCPFTAGMNVANVVGDILESKGWAVVQLSDSDALCLPGTASTTTMAMGLKIWTPETGLFHQFFFQISACLRVQTPNDL